MGELAGAGFVAVAVGFLAFHTNSSLHKESPAELMLLTFLWDKTASGTARRKTSVLLLTVPEAVLSDTKARSRSAFQSINFEQNSVLLLAVPEAVSSQIYIYIYRG